MVAALAFGSFAAPARAALNESQIQSILSLLSSFGADQSTINNVNASLRGQPTTGGTTGGTTTGGACPALTRDLQQGSTGADVKALQVFLNASADTQVAASGAGSPGSETSTFGPATKAAVMKFQTKYGITPVAGYVGAKSRAQIASVCGGTTTGGGTTTPTPTGSGLTVSAAAQPANGLAPDNVSRLPFTNFTVTASNDGDVTLNSVTVQRTGVAQDAAFSGVELVDLASGVQIGISKTLNSNHQATIGEPVVIKAGTSRTFTVAANRGTTSSYSGQIASFSVVAVNTSAAVNGSLPIMGASHTINESLSLGSVSTTTSAFDPGAAQTRNIGDTAVRFSGVKFTAGSTEDLRLYSIRWRQVGSASSVDLSNVQTVVDGVSYAASVSTDGKYYTTSFPGGLLITKGNSIDAYIQGDIVGSNSASRTVDFDIDKVTDVYFVGQLYGYGIAPSGTYQPWYNGYVTTLNAGTVTTISKSNSGKGAAQNIAINVSNQPLGGFTTNFAGEAVSITGLTATVATSSASTGLLTSVSLVDENGSVVAGPVDATWVSGTQTLTYTDSVTFPVGVHSYYFQGKVPSTATGGAGIALTTTPSGWTSPTGQNSGNTVSLSGTSAVTMNTMTVKGGALTVSLSTTPASQNITAGASQFTFANVLLDAQQSGEDVRLASVPLTATGNVNNLSGCQLFDGATALNTSSRVVNTVNSGVKTTFSFDNVLRIPKGTIKTLAVKCNLSSAATSSSSVYFATDTTTGDYSVTGDTSGVSITPTITTSTGGTMTVQTASLTLSVDSSSPASTTVAGGSTGQTIGVFKVKGSNDNITLTKIGMVLTSGAATNVTLVHLFNGATEIGTATFGSGQTIATSTLNGAGLALAQDVDTKITIKADVADVGTGKAGTEGAVIQINPSSAEGIGTSGTVQAAGSGSTAGVRLYNSYPTFAYDTTGGNGTLNNGTQQLLALNVTADAAGDVGLYKLTFSISTTTVSVTSPTFQGPNGNVASSTLAFGTNATLLTVYFDSTSNTSDAVVGAGTTKTYYFGGTVAGLTTTGGVVSVALKADTTANGSMAIPTSTTGTTNIIWSPLATTSMTTGGVNLQDFTNGYALTKGCFASVGLANDCNARSISK